MKRITAGRMGHHNSKSELNAAQAAAMHSANATSRQLLTVRFRPARCSCAARWTSLRRTYSSWTASLNALQHNRHKVQPERLGGRILPDKLKKDLVHPFFHLERA